MRFHRHQWQTIAAQQGVYEHYKNALKIGPDSPYTELLQRCECGEVRTKTVDGHWTIEQLNQ